MIRAATGRRLLIVAMVAVGAAYALVAPLDAGLGREVGSLPAAFVDFAVGALVMTGIVIASGRLGGVRAVGDAPRHALLGGACGAAFVTAMVVTVPTLGAGGVAAATVSGQLATSLVIDRSGRLGVPSRPLSAWRVGGVALLLAGTVLIVLA